MGVLVSRQLEGFGFNLPGQAVLPVLWENNKARIGNVALVAPHLDVAEAGYFTVLQRNNGVAILDFGPDVRRLPLRDAGAAGAGRLGVLAADFFCKDFVGSVSVEDFKFHVVNGYVDGSQGCDQINN